MHTVRNGSTRPAVVVVLLLSCTNCGRSAGEPGKPTTWKVTLAGQQLLESLENVPDVTPAQPALAVKLTIDYTGTDDALLTEGQLRLTAPDDTPCPLLGLGSAGGSFQEFNLYAPPGGGWFGFDYPAVDVQGEADEGPAFGVRRTAPTAPATLLFHKKQQVLLLGFYVPGSTGEYRLQFGDAAPVTIAVTR